MNKLTVEEQVREVAAGIAERQGLEFVHAEVVGSKKDLTVRVFIDKEGGVTHEDCSAVSSELSDVLDVEDLIPSAYVLEVSSPGLERGLYSLKDFEKFSGSEARLKTKRAISGQRNFTGQIVEVKEDTIVFDDKTNGIVSIPYETVDKANLQVNLEEELKKGLGS